jgi:hypothetical protein
MASSCLPITGHTLRPISLVFILRRHNSASTRPDLPWTKPTRLSDPHDIPKDHNPSDDHISFCLLSLILRTVTYIGYSRYNQLIHHRVSCQSRKERTRCDCMILWWGWCLCYFFSGATQVVPCNVACIRLFKGEVLLLCCSIAR